MNRAGSSVSLAILIVAGVDARATDHFNLESGIPTTIEDIEPIERGAFEAQGFATYLRSRGADGDSGETQPRLAIGILPATQLEIGLPLVVGHGAATGNGDVQLSTLRKFRDASRKPWSPGFAIEVDVDLPTGVARQGSRNKLGAGVEGLAKLDLGTHAFHVNAGFDWNRDESDEGPPRRMSWNAAVGHHAELTRSIVLVSDLAWRQSDETGTSAVWLLENGIRVQLEHDVIGAIGIGAGLGGGPDTPSLTLTVGVQVGL